MASCCNRLQFIGFGTGDPGKFPRPGSPGWNGQKHSKCLFSGLEVIWGKKPKAPTLHCAYGHSEPKWISRLSIASGQWSVAVSVLKTGFWGAVRSVRSGSESKPPWSSKSKEPRTKTSEFDEVMPVQRCKGKGRARCKVWWRPLPRCQHCFSPSRVEQEHFVVVVSTGTTGLQLAHQPLLWCPPRGVPLCCTPVRRPRNGVGPGIQWNLGVGWCPVARWGKGDIGDLRMGHAVQDQKGKHLSHQVPFRGCAPGSTAEHRHE